MTAAAHELEAVCEGCHTPIADGEGAAWADTTVKKGRWHVHHYNCVPNFPWHPFVVDIDVTSLRTWEALETWTAQQADRPVGPGFAALVAMAAQPDSRQLPAGLRPLPAGGR